MLMLTLLQPRKTAAEFRVAYDRMAAHINSCIEREGGSITASRHRELLTEYLKYRPADKEALASHTMYVVEGDGSSTMKAEVVPSTDGGYLAVLMSLE